MSRLPKNGQGLNMREKWVTNILLTHKMRQIHSHRSFREPIGRQRESHQSNQLLLEHLQKTRGKWTGSKNEKIRCSIRAVYLLWWYLSILLPFPNSNKNIHCPIT